MRVDVKKLSICAFDDNAQSLTILSQMLAGFGAKHCDKFTELSDVAAEVARVRYDLILLDNDSINNAGLKVAKAVRSDENGPNFTAPILLLSLSTSAMTISSARDQGVNFVVAKPIAPAVLLERMVWLARRPRPFVNSDNYRGPDRRFHIAPVPAGATERRAENLRMMQAPERDLGQSEIDSLFS